jgi:hypothetical protein
MLTTVVAWAAIIGSIVAAATFVRSMIRAGRSEKERQEAKRDAARTAAFADGRASRDDEVNLLRSQRDDARRERDNMRTERDDWRRQALEQRRNT